MAWTTLSHSLFPYTTLFRSLNHLPARHASDFGHHFRPRRPTDSLDLRPLHEHRRIQRPTCLLAGRSEEHTSELQSRQYLVCRLLLEKKKDKYISTEQSTHDL